MADLAASPKPRPSSLDSIESIGGTSVSSASSSSVITSEGTSNPTPSPLIISSDSIADDAEPPRPTAESSFAEKLGLKDLFHTSRASTTAPREHRKSFMPGRERTNTSDGGVVSLKSAKSTFFSRSKSTKRATGPLLFKNDVDDGTPNHPLFPVIRNGILMLPYGAEVPYSASYWDVDQECDVANQELLAYLARDRPSFIEFPDDKPPECVLDLGCGNGYWMLKSAATWTNTLFYGLDVATLHQSQTHLRQHYSGDVVDRVKFRYGDFLKKLPFNNESFDYIRMSHISLCIPKHRWRPLFEEVDRVLKPGGRIEFIDEPIKFLGGMGVAAGVGQRDICDDLEAHFTNYLISQGFVMDVFDDDTPRAQTALERIGHAERIRDFKVSVALFPETTPGGKDEEETAELRAKALLIGEHIMPASFDITRHSTRSMQLLAAHRAPLSAYLHELSKGGLNLEEFKAAMFQYESEILPRIGLLNCQWEAGEEDVLVHLRPPIFATFGSPSKRKERHSSSASQSSVDVDKGRGTTLNVRKITVWTSRKPPTTELKEPTS